jgi:hypothetical protein
LIKKGMTEAEVQSILGVAPGDYARPAPGPKDPFDDLALADGGWHESSEVYWAMRTGSKKITWGSDFHCIFVYFDREGKVSATHFGERHRSFLAPDGRRYIYDPSMKAKLWRWWRGWPM